MRYLLLTLLSISPLIADMQAPVLPQKHFRFDKIQIYNHSYVIITENIPGFAKATSQAVHDPDCGCRNLKEEQISKIIQEVIRLKDIEHQKSQQ